MPVPRLQMAHLHQVDRKYRKQFQRELELRHIDRVQKCAHLIRNMYWHVLRLQLLEFDPRAFPQLQDLLSLRHRPFGSPQSKFPDLPSKRDSISPAC